MKEKKQRTKAYTSYTTQKQVFVIFIYSESIKINLNNTGRKRKKNLRILETINREKKNNTDDFQEFFIKTYIKQNKVDGDEISSERKYIRTLQKKM